MTRTEMKRKMAAVLCMAMISGCVPVSAWAEQEATPGEGTARQQSEAAQEQTAPPVVELITPPAQEQTTPPAQEQTTPPAQEQTTPPAQEQTTPPAQEQTTPPAQEQTAPPAQQKDEKTDDLAKQEQSEETAPAYAEFTMKYDVRDGVIVVTIEGATDGKMIDIRVTGNGVDEMNGILCENGRGSGELGRLNEAEERFEALEPGEYTVTAQYASMESIRRSVNVTIKGEETSAPPAVIEPIEPVEVTPPTDAGSEPATPPAEGGQDEVKTFTAQPVVNADGTVSVVIEGASEREIEMMLFDKDNKELARTAIIGNGVAELGKFPGGTYTLQAQYVTPVQNADGSFDFMAAVTPVVVADGAATDPEPVQPIDIQAKVETGSDYLLVTVTDAAETDMLVFVNNLEPKPITKGGSVRFDGLTPGERYEIEIDYVNVVQGTSPFRETVTIPLPVVLGEIQITAVTPGVNKLTVSGTATAAQQIILTTNPAASGDVYVMTDQNGAFSAEISCAANTYTSVTARYVKDGTIAKTVSGSWVVAAPAAKPELTVDPIDTTSTTVVAKTTPGIVVEIRTSDYTQKVTADGDGILRFSLPHTYAAGTTFTFAVYYGDGQSFTQTAAVQTVPYLGTLEYGDTGDAVRKLTARLAALGYPTKETSRYGSTVREAVRLFQRANGLDDDGIAGRETQQKLFSVSAIPYGEDRYPTLVRGDRGYALIYTLQQRLKDLGYYTIKVDGIFGSGTQRAVRLFQQVNGLTVTGKADHATQALLYSSSAKPVGSGVSGDYKTLSRSSRYQSRVVPMQRRLMALGYYFGNIDGYFGSQTYRAVRNFQSRNGLTVTGVADPYTQEVLYSSSAKAASGSSSSGSSSGYRLLYWGCRGDSVKRLQQALIDAGYKSIVRTADGIFGQWTYDAVKAYQKNHGLAVDGIAGKNTQNSLYGTNY